MQCQFSEDYHTRGFGQRVALGWFKCSTRMRWCYVMSTVAVLIWELLGRRSLAAGGSKPGAAAEAVIKSMVRVAAQPSPAPAREHWYGELPWLTALWCTSHVCCGSGWPLHLACSLFCQGVWLSSWTKFILLSNNEINIVGHFTSFHTDSHSLCSFPFLFY